MKEFDENFNPTEESEELTAEAEQPVSLEEELESIKDMFQTELDNAMYGEADDSEADIAEYYNDSDEADGENEPEEEAAIPEEDLCECCGEKERDKSLGEDYPYCNDCRELMKKYPLGFKGIATLIAVLVLIVVSVLYVFPQNLTVLSTSLTADEYVSQGKLYSGLYTYYSALSSIDKENPPKKFVARCAKAFAGLNDYIDASYLAETYLTEADLRLPAYKELNNYKFKSESLQAVENAIYEPLSKTDRSEEDIDDIIAILDSLAEQEDAEYDPFYIDYYKYVVMHTLGADLTEQFDKLAEIDEKYGDTEWIHYYDLCNAAALLGHIDTAEIYFNKIIKINAEDGSAYAYYANAYRYSETPDADKMLEIVNKGLEAQGNYSYATSDLYRTQALAYLLKGDTDKALESAGTMYSAISASNYSVSNLFESLYTYALCALAADDTEAYKNVTELLKYNKYEVPDEVIKAAKSETGIVNLITDPEGVLS